MSFSSEGQKPDIRVGDPTPYPRVAASIDTDYFIRRYEVANPFVAEVIKEYPTLSYLLGRVTHETKTEKTLQDGTKGNIYFLTEGSGMFGLTNTEDALEWAGIFNHIVGSLRHTYFLGLELGPFLSSEQREEFKKRGYDFGGFDDIGFLNLFDFMFISHAGRRQMDEYNWYGLRDNVHQTGESYTNTLELLDWENAPMLFLALLNVESHGKYLLEAGRGGMFPDIVTALLTYADWTFGQTQNSLEERFKSLRASKRAPEEQLDVFESAGQAFQEALEEIVRPTIFDEMAHVGPYEWETRVRKAYCASSGISLAEAFPGYATQFPDVVK